MLPQDSPNLPKPKCRLSCFSGGKSRANKLLDDGSKHSTHVAVRDFNLLLQEKREKTLCPECLDAQNHTALFVEQSAPTASFRKARASFSGFTCAIADLRNFPKRMASHRRKSFVMPEKLASQKQEYSPCAMSSAADDRLTESSTSNEDLGQEPHQGSPGWIRRCVSTTFRRRRPTVDTPSRPATAKWEQQEPFYLQQQPSIGLAPPSLPDDNSSGAAARAAAAAQNEILDYMRRVRAKECNGRGDAESGVGIDMWHVGPETAIARRGSPSSLTIPENSSEFHIGGQGLGDDEADQEWKKMWKTRKALHQRWTDGHAAAIYLEGHYDSVYCVQFDEILGIPARSKPITLEVLPDSGGRRPFTKRFSQQFRLAPTVDEPAIYHVGSILCLQYDEELMITGSSDFTCIMWDIKADWTPIRRVKYHNAGVLDVCFDKKHVVSCSKDTSVCLWDRQTGDLIHRLHGHRGPVNAVQLRGNLAVSASGDGVSKLWNLVSGNCVKEFHSRDRGMACVEFSLDSLTVFAGGNDQVIYQFDASTGELIRELKGHSDLVRSLHLDSANGRIVSGSYDTSVRAYDVRTGDTVVEFTGWTASWILSAKLDYRRIVATSQDSRVLVIDFGFELPGMGLLERNPKQDFDSVNDLRNMGESRQELLSWLNDLLQLNVTRIEDCGTGAVLCQIYDSIDKDVPMNKVKFEARTETDYLHNFKVLQQYFLDKEIPRSIPVQALVRCKMQDNLEFLQWTKRHWNVKWPGGPYDAVGRRKGAGRVPATAAPAPIASARTSGAGAARRGTTPTTARPRRTGAAGGTTASAAALQEINQMKETVAGLERERDFYFSKLRDIELLLQQAVDDDPELDKEENSLIKQVQAILYSTEEGFEIPADDGVADDQETF
ncbi:MAG: hypothetical protein Q9228_001323 [Teloschistes exilis]